MKDDEPEKMEKMLNDELEKMQKMLDELEEMLKEKVEKDEEWDTLEIKNVKLVPLKRFCPLRNGECKLHECMWFLSDGTCAISRIAIRLDALVEGIPVIRLFKEK